MLELVFVCETVRELRVDGVLGTEHPGLEERSSAVSRCAGSLGQRVEQRGGVAIEQRLHLLALRLAHRLATDALGSGLVLLARERLHLDAELVQHGLDVVGLGGETEERERRLRREVDALGGGSDVELAVAAASGKKHDGLLAFVAEAEDLLTEPHAHRPAGLEWR